jgi:hypothetical protein
MLAMLSLLISCSPDPPVADPAPNNAVAGTPNVPMAPERPTAEATPKTEQAGTPPASAQTHVDIFGMVGKLGGRSLYYGREITDEDLEGRGLTELALMRNTIYARTGHRFVKPWLASYFGAQGWYRPSDTPDYASLTEVDRQNAKRISEAEGSFTTEQLISMRDQLSEGHNDEDWRKYEQELRMVSIRLGEWQGGDSMQGGRHPLEDPSMLSEQLQASQLENLSRRDLRILRNTIFARHGRPFKSELLTQHFEATLWYLADASYRDSRLSGIDLRNLSLIQSVEKTQGGPLSDEEHMHEEWYSGA